MKHTEIMGPIGTTGEILATLKDLDKLGEPTDRNPLSHITPGLTTYVLEFFNGKWGPLYEVKDRTPTLTFREFVDKYFEPLKD